MKDKIGKMILHLKNEEINTKNMMGEGPNEERENQYEINQAQKRMFL